MCLGPLPRRAKGSRSNQSSTMNNADFIQCRSSASPYRPLNRTKNEIRLLRILPSVRTPSATHSLDISNDPVRCQLEYHDFEQFSTDEMQKTQSMTTTGRGIKNKNKIQNKLTSRKTDNADEARTRAINKAFEDNADYLQKLIQSGYGGRLDQKYIWDEWRKTWLWTNLPKEPGEETLSGYIALSYVWSKQPDMSQEEARMLKTRTKLLEISPASAGLLDKAMPPSDSHLWPRAYDEAEIILDGSSFKVGTNLEKALRALRETPEVRSGLLVWADALCINQNDIEERNFEISRMGSIYRRAVRVASWLSEVDDTHIKALEFMNIVGKFASDVTEYDSDRLSIWFPRYELVDCVGMLAALWHLPYWHRMWIIQEVELAPPGSYIICGNRRFPWANILDFRHKFSTGVALFHNKFGQGSEESKDQDQRRREVIYASMSLEGRVTHLQEFRHRFAKGPDYLDAFLTMYHNLASASACRDPRDRVYAFMSLFPEGVAARIKPDYGPSKTTAMVMADFAMAHIQTTMTLFMLQMVSDISPAVDVWPSWVPNWSAPVRPGLKWWRRARPPTSRERRLKPTIYRADGAVKARVKFLPPVAYGVPALACAGMKLDAISEVGQGYKSGVIDGYKRKLISSGRSDSSEQTLLGIFRELINSGEPPNELAWQLKEFYTCEMERAQKPDHPPIAKCKIHKYGDDAGLTRALESCFLVAGFKDTPSGCSIFDMPLGSIGDPESPPEWGYKRFFRFCTRMSEIDFWGRNLESFFRKHEFPDSDVPWLGFGGEFYRVTRGNLFTTAGGYVGLTIDRIQPGDEIWILFGLPMPAVLRKVDGHYRLVCTVYVHGVMDGEAVGEFLAERRRYRMVTIV